MVYNKGLFDRFGYDHPKDNMTMDELQELTGKMSRVIDGTNYYGLGMSPNHVLVADPLGPVFIDPSENVADFSSEKFRKSFQTLTGFFTVLNNEYDDKTWSYSAQLKLFSEGNLAMLLGPSPLGPRYFADNYDGLDWDITTYPRYKEAPDVGPQNAPGYFYVTSNSLHKDVAFQVAAHVTSLEFQKHIARNGYTTAVQVPEVISEYGKDLPFLKDKNVQALYIMNPASIVTLTEFQAFAVGEIQNMFKEFILNKKDINTILREADERVNQKITEEIHLRRQNTAK